MADTLHLPKTQDRAALYAALFPQLEAILSGESDQIANFANTAAALHEAFNFLWIGFYRVKEGELVLGPFQGPIACTRIAFRRGVCGRAYQDAATLIVPDVNAFPGHIACSSLSQSEIVVPIFDRSGAVVAVLDVDSEKLADFSELDQKWLEKIAGLLLS